jgi:hypothetical protein
MLFILCPLLSIHPFIFYLLCPLLSNCSVLSTLCFLSFAIHQLPFLLCSLLCIYTLFSVLCTPFSALSFSLCLGTSLLKSSKDRKKQSEKLRNRLNNILNRISLPSKLLLSQEIFLSPQLYVLLFFIFSGSDFIIMSMLVFCVFGQH